MIKETPESILEFWFGKEHKKQSNLEISEKQSHIWWLKDKEVDQEILRRFADCSEGVISGELNDWEKTPSGFLALILCTDQFPRNMYRNKDQSYFYDSKSLSLAKKCVDQKIDEQMSLIYRVFSYMPFEHSEQLEDQERCMLLFQNLLEMAPSDEKELFKRYIQAVEQHRYIIKRFNRFPHRNKILGRESTEEELEFLKQDGSSF